MTDRAKAIALHFLRTGQMTIPEVAVRAGISRVSVWKWAKAAGLDLERVRVVRCDIAWRRREMSYVRAPRRRRRRDNNEE